MPDLLVRFRSATFASNPSIIYLSHVISGHFVRPDTSRLRDLATLTTVRTLSEAKATYGYLSFWRSYIPAFAQRTTAIKAAATVKSQRDFKWTSTEIAELADVYKVLKDNICLHFFEENAPETYLVIDSSIRAGGGALLQRCPKSQKLEVTGLMSKCYPPRKKYANSAFACELLALYLALQKWYTELQVSKQIICVTVVHLLIFTISKSLARKL